MLKKLKSPIKSKPKSKSKSKPKTKPKPTTKTVVSLSPVNDKQWQIQDDARTLKQAQAIKQDPMRMKAAQEYCMKEMDSLKQIAKMK